MVADGTRDAGISDHADHILVEDVDALADQMGEEGARRMAEKALTAVIPSQTHSVRREEAYIQGISTRSVDDLVKAMGMSGISRSQVGGLCAEIDDKVKALLARPMEGDWPYLWIDATYLKVRRGGRIILGGPASVTPRSGLRARRLPLQP